VNHSNLLLIIKLIPVLLVNVFVLEGIAQLLVFFLVTPPQKSIAVEDSQLGWVFQGCRDQASLGYGNFELCFNQQSLRMDKTIQSPVSVMVLGNSITLSQQIAAQKTFVHLIGGVNAGFDGYTTYQQLERFSKDLHHLAPEQLILVVEVTDIISSQESKKKAGLTLWSNLEIQRNSPLLNVLRREGIWQLYLWKSQLDMETRQDLIFLKLVNKPIDSAVWREWTEAVLEIRKLQKSREFVIVFSPPRSQVQAYLEGNRHFLINETLRNFCQGSSIPFVDLLPALAANHSEEVFYDARHYNELGHQLASIRLERLSLIQ